MNRPAKNLTFLMLLVTVALLSSCNVYRQDVMLRLDDEFTENDLAQATQVIQQNYQLQPNDYLELEVFTNGGERIVDPNFELSRDINVQAMNSRQEFRYLVQADGRVKFPMVGLVSVEGMTIQEAESVLETLYNDIYKETFVKLTYLNKRVIVLGANGGAVIPLENENVSVLEAIALAGGMPPTGKAANIKLIRNIGTDSLAIYRLDLSRISAMRDGLQIVQETDIIYIEPWRRPVNQALRDITPILSIFSSILTVIVIIRSFREEDDPMP